MSKKKNNFVVNRIHLIDDQPTIKAFVDVSVADLFVVKGVRILNGSKGLFVSMPQHHAKDDKFYDVAHPTSKALREDVNDVVLKAYENEVEKKGGAN